MPGSRRRRASPRRQRRGSAGPRVESRSATASADRTSHSKCREGAGFVILGRSGTGKSVTLRHIIGLVRPDSGRVFVEGDEISALDGPELSRVRRKMGFLFQNAALFDSISRRRERGVSDAAPHRDAASATSATRAPRKACGGRSGAGIRQDAGRALGRHAQARRAGPSAGARSARSCWSTSRVPGSIRSPPTKSTSCCSVSSRAAASRWSSSLTTFPAPVNSATAADAARRACLAPRARPRTWTAAATSLVRAFMASQHAG